MLLSELGDPGGRSKLISTRPRPLMLCNRLIDLDNPQPLRRVLGQALEAAGGPEGLALGFEPFQVEVGHQSWVRPLVPM